MIKIHNFSIAINDLSISNYNSAIHKAYTQEIMSPNWTPYHTYKQKNYFLNKIQKNQICKIIVIVTLGLLILSISLYLLYQFKEIPKRIFIKYTKGDDPTIETQELQNSQELQEIPKLYPKIT